MDSETEKLKYAVINMHFSALLLCAVCWPVVFWTDENIPFSFILFKAREAVISGKSNYGNRSSERCAR